jgi:hypothetical protein
MLQSGVCLRACMTTVSEPSRYPLAPHATSPQTAAERLVVEVVRGGQNCLQLSFRLSGDIGALVLPMPTASVRADGLWRHTCFEAFVAAAGSPRYWEFNFSSSGAWAAYHFMDYRTGMSPVVEASAPVISSETGATDFTLTATLDLGWLLRSQAEGGLRLGLTAVIEDRERGLSYWALRHGADKPDFHLAESFLVALA